MEDKAAYWKTRAGQAEDWLFMLENLMRRFTSPCETHHGRCVAHREKLPCPHGDVLGLIAEGSLYFWQRRKASDVGNQQSAGED